MPQVICKIRRKGGTKIEFRDGAVYHFKPTDSEPNGDHVAEVSDPAHVARFREIPESFIVAGKAGAAKPSGVDAELAADRAEFEDFAKRTCQEFDQIRADLEAGVAQLKADREAFEQEKAAAITPVADDKAPEAAPAADKAKADAKPAAAKK